MQHSWQVPLVSKKKIEEKKNDLSKTGSPRRDWSFFGAMDILTTEWPSTTLTLLYGYSKC